MAKLATKKANAQPKSNPPKPDPKPAITEDFFNAIYAKAEKKFKPQKDGEANDVRLKRDKAERDREWKEAQEDKAHEDKWKAKVDEEVALQIAKKFKEARNGKKVYPTKRLRDIGAPAGSAEAQDVDDDDDPNDKDKGDEEEDDGNGPDGDGGDGDNGGPRQSGAEPEPEDEEPARGRGKQAAGMEGEKGQAKKPTKVTRANSTAPNRKRHNETQATSATKEPQEPPPEEPTSPLAKAVKIKDIQKTDTVQHVTTLKGLKSGWYQLSCPMPGCEEWAPSASDLTPKHKACHQHIKTVHADKYPQKAINVQTVFKICGKRIEDATEEWFEEWKITRLWSPLEKISDAKVEGGAAEKTAVPESQMERTAKRKVSDTSLSGSGMQSKKRRRKTIQQLAANKRGVAKNDDQAEEEGIVEDDDSGAVTEKEVEATA